MCFPGGSDSTESTCNVGDQGSISGLGRSPGGGHGNALQYSFLGNVMDRGAWRATIHRDAEQGTTEATWPTCRFVISFLPWGKHLSISWLQSLSMVILEPKKIKSVTASTFPLSVCHEVMVPDAMIFFFFLNVEFQASFFTLLFHTHQEAL